MEIRSTQIMREFQQQHNNTDSNKTKDNLRKQRQTQFVVSAHKTFLWNSIRNVFSKAIRLILFKLNSWNNCIKEFIFLLVKKMVHTLNNISVLRQTASYVRALFKFTRIAHDAMTQTNLLLRGNHQRIIKQVLWKLFLKQLLNTVTKKRCTRVLLHNHLTFEISPSWPSSLQIHWCDVLLYTRPVPSAEQVAMYWPV